MAGAILLVALALCCCAANAAAAEEQIATKVRALFKLRCNECHGEHLARPKGRFGYINDLARVAANPDFVVRSEPDKSELYLLVLHGDMPGEEADLSELPDEEKELIRRWIELGAPVEPASSAVEATPGQTVDTTGSRCGFARVMEWIGRLHPAATHFPIAMVIAAAVGELLLLKSRREQWTLVVRYCLWFGAVAGVITAALGYANAAFSSYTAGSAELLEWHRWAGTVTAAWLLLTAVAGEWGAASGPRRRWLFRPLLFTGAGLVVVTAFLGGSLIHGLNYYWR